MFTVDIDSNSILRLLKTTKKALNLGLDIKRIDISPSHHGFHIIINNDGSDIEALINRALLDDDPVRLRYSIKRMSMGGEADVCFDRKERHDSIPIDIDMDEIKRVEIDDLGEVVQKYEKRIGKLMKKVFLTVFEVPDNHEDKIREVLSDIAERDESFRYKIYPNLYKKGKTKWIGVVYSPDKNTAHKRGTWLKKKVLVDEKEIIKGYWVKEIEKK